MYLVKKNYEKAEVRCPQSKIEKHLLQANRPLALCLNYSVLFKLILSILSILSIISKVFPILFP